MAASRGLLPRLLVIEVQPGLVDVADNTVGHQIPDGLAFTDAFSTLGRGDRQGRDLDQGDLPLGQTGIGELVPRSVTAYEMREFEKFIRVVPAQNRAQRIRSRDEEQLHVRAVLPAHLAQRIDRVGGPRSEEHTSELQSRENLVCRLLLEKKK